MSEIHRDYYPHGVPERTSIIHWGAVFAGLIFIVAAGWLLFALGGAIGFSVADVTDLQAMGQGLGMGAAIWLIVSTLIVFFLGGLLAGYLSGDPVRRNGMLHGLVLWSAGTALTLVLGAMTLGALWRAGESLVSGAAQAAQGVGSAVVQGGQAAAGGAQSAMQALEGSPAFDALLAELKRAAAQSLSGQSGAVSQQEAGAAIEQIDPGTLRNASTALIQGDAEQARQILARDTNLSEQEVATLVDNLSNRVQESDTVEQVQGWMQEQASAVSQSVSQVAGGEVSQQELERAVQQLDADVLRQVGMALVQGDTDAARDALTVNTTLTDEEIEAIVEGVSDEVQERVDAVREQVSSTVETVSNYVQAVMWTEVIASALALVLAAAGGAMGAGRIRRAPATTTAATDRPPPQ